MKIDRASVNERIDTAIIVEDRTVPDDQTPERVRMQLDGMDVVIAVEAHATGSNQLVATCDLPFLRLGSRLNLERAGRDSRIHRGTLDWVALDVSDDAQMPRIQLGLGLDQLDATEEANKQDTAPNEQALSSPKEAQTPSLPLPPSASTSRRWLGRLALVALGVVGAGVGSAIAGSGEAPQASSVTTVLAVPLPPQIIVTPPPKSTPPMLVAPSTKKTRTAASRNKTLRARRATAKRSRLKRIKTRRYLAWARTAMRRRRPKRAQHLARLVLLLDPGNRSASAILSRR
jgi:hypothetical protein